MERWQKTISTCHPSRSSCYLHRKRPGWLALLPLLPLLLHISSCCCREPPHLPQLLLLNLNLDQDLNQDHHLPLHQPLQQPLLQPLHHHCRGHCRRLSRCLSLPHYHNHPRHRSLHSPRRPWMGHPCRSPSPKRAPPWTSSCHPHSSQSQQHCLLSIGCHLWPHRRRCTVNTYLSAYQGAIEVSQTYYRW